MRSNQRSPMWPYMLVLTGLFVLSVAVPRGWQEASHGEQPASATARSSATETPFAVSPAIVRPAARSEVTGSAHVPALDVPDLEPLRPAPDHRAAAPAVSQAPQVEDVAEKIADARRFGDPHNDAAKADGPLDRVIEQDELDQTPPPPATSKTDAPVAPSRNAILSTAYWPIPQTLLSQLDELSKHAPCAAWSARVEELCVELCRTPPGDYQHAQECLQQLESMNDRADEVLKQLKNAGGAADLRRARYTLQRRLLVWKIVFAEKPQSQVFASLTTGDARRQELAGAVRDADLSLRQLPHGDVWQKYLRLDELSAATGSSGLTQSADSEKLARDVLNRIDATDASQAQREVLAQPGIQRLSVQLHNFVGDLVPAHEVLSAIERYESTRLVSDGRKVIKAEQQLQWSSDDRDRQLANHIDEHYRNANVRVVLTAELLNRFTPETTVTAGDVNDTVLGNPVSGSSLTTTNLRLRLIPDPRRVHAWLEAEGSVDSDTNAYSGPATFSNRGEATYVARKAILLDSHGLGIAPAISQADSDSWLTGVSTDYDGIPLLGRISRNVAISKQQAVRGAARQEVEAKVASKASEKLDSEVERRLQQAEAKVRQQWLDPLDHLGLELKPIALETATERVTMRLRLAGASQPGGHTARPQAPSDSMASTQLHESALNNLLDQLQLAGRMFTLPELYKHLGERTSRSLTLPEDAPDNVTIQFAKTDPVRMRCQDGEVELTLAIDELRQGQCAWHDFLITATYVPEVEGRHARLARDGAIRLGGETYKGKPEVVLRGIFSKILSRERKLELVPAFVADHPRLTDLGVTQFTIADGWIALALGPDRQPRPPVNGLRVGPTADTQIGRANPLR